MKGEGGVNKDNGMSIDRCWTVRWPVLTSHSEHCNYIWNYLRMSLAWLHQINVPQLEGKRFDMVSCNYIHSSRCTLQLYGNLDYY